MPKIEATAATFSDCDFHELTETFAGQSHLVRVGHYSNATKDIYTVTSHKLPKGYFSFTETEAFTTKLGVVHEGRRIATQVSINLGKLEKDEAYDTFAEAMKRANKLVTKIAKRRCA